MTRSDQRPSSRQRITDYLACEDRLVLSAQALTALVAGSPGSDTEHLAPALPLADRAADLREDLAYIQQRYGLRGGDQTVAVIDSGIAYDHIALGGGFGPGHRVVGGWDFTDENDADPYDDAPAGFHGTHVAGILGSDDDRYPGLAPEVDFVALRVFDDQGGGRLAWLEDALGWVHEHRDDFAHPITTGDLSLGHSLLADDTTSWNMLDDEFAQLKADGIFIAVAAGNSYATQGGGELSFPASSLHVVPVASLDSEGRLSEFSQRDARILAAPGENVFSTVPSHLFGGAPVANDFARAHGTSMATPAVAGASILVREALQSLGQTNIDQTVIETQLRETADVFYDPQTQQNYLQLNLRRSIDELLAPTVADDGAATGVESHLLRRVEDHWLISGTTGDDHIEIHVAAPTRITINGLEVVLPDEESLRIEVAGTGGADTLVLQGSSADESVTIDGSTLQWTGPSLSVVATDIAIFELHAGSGFDLAHLVDTPGDEYLEAYPDRAEWRSAAGSTSLTGFSRLYATADQGGYDQAELHGSSDSDRFYGHPRSATLSGLGFYLQADGFHRITAIAGSGGSDVAELHDSSQNDRLYAYANQTTMSGLGYQLQVSGFAQVEAFATLGGDDRANLYDSPGDDRFYGRATYVTLSGPQRLVKVHGFDRVSGHAVAGGEDRAFFFGSPVDDRFRGSPTTAQMTGMGYHNVARGFDYVHAEAAGGIDSAELVGSLSNDRLASHATGVELSGGTWQTHAVGFGSVQIYGGGGSDHAHAEDLDASTSVYGRDNQLSIADRAVLKTLHDFAEVDILGRDYATDLAALDFVFRELPE